MIKEIKEKLNTAWQWIKSKAKQILVALGIVGIAIAAEVALQPAIPSIIAEGQTISFPYTDNNSDENLIIYTDKEIYTPLWAWNGFDVYVAVENKSEKSQPVSFQSFFQKDFSVEQVFVLNPNATTTIKEPIYEEICQETATTIGATTTGATTTSCYQKKTGEKEKVVLGVWIPSVQQQFSKEEYDKTILDNKIKVKQKIGNKVAGNFIDYSLAGQFSYYKLRIKSNEPFSREEFSVEAIGQNGAYGLLDPTIFTDDFNLYNDGNLNDQGNWSGGAGQQVQGVTVYEGAKAVKVVNLAAASNIEKIGSLVAAGKTSFYFKTSTLDGSYTVSLFILEGATLINGVYSSEGTMYLYNTNLGAVSLNVWHLVEMEWATNSGTDQARARIDGGSWCDWGSGWGQWTTGVNTVRIYSSAGTYTTYYDYIAENPYVPPAVAVPQMQVIIIE